MVIGVLQLEIGVPDAMSLKDKRRVIKSIKDRIAHAHNVSIAEVGAFGAGAAVWAGATGAKDSSPASKTSHNNFGFIRINFFTLQLSLLVPPKR